MKIAIISDIHGNMQALEAVLADIKLEKCDKIFCLGDLAMAGPEPARVVEIIKEMNEDDNFVVIQGNTDEMIGSCTLETINRVKSAFPVMGEALEDDCKIIPKNLKDFLKKLPKQYEIKIEGLKILLVHGSPRKNDENILPDLPIEKIEEMLSATDADVVFCGHTHMPCGYQTTKNQTVVNDGSVGRPFTQNPQSCYVLAEFISGKFTVTHKFLDYDQKKASELLSKRNFKGADKMAEILINPAFRHI